MTNEKYLFRSSKNIKLELIKERLIHIGYKPFNKIGGFSNAVMINHPVPGSFYYLTITNLPEFVEIHTDCHLGYLTYLFHTPCKYAFERVKTTKLLIV